MSAGAGREPDPLTRPCDECGALPGEPCFPDCTGAAQQLELERAAPRTVGTHFLADPPDDHNCTATCYRPSSDGRAIITLCDYAHIVHRGETGPRSSFAGSAFAASLNDLPATAPFVMGDRS